MPTYLYSCEQCNQQFEVEHKMSEELEECPKCKENGLPLSKPKRLISATSFVLNGGGWAKEGYS